MEKTMELKMLLESSLKRIFQATVTDILVSVEQTLSEYQGTIQTIQTENEGLKRLLSAQRSAESLHEGPQFFTRGAMVSVITVSQAGDDATPSTMAPAGGSEEDAAEHFPGSDWDNHPVTSTHTMCKVPKCSNEKTSFRKPNESTLKESASSPPFSLQMDQLEEESCVDKSSRASVPVKIEPNLEESGAIDLSQSSQNQTVKLLKNERSGVTGVAFTDVHLLHPSGLKYESIGSDHSVKVTVVSRGYTQEGHFIKIEEEEEAEALPGSEGDSLPQPEVKYGEKYQEAELDQRLLEGESMQDVEQREGTLEQNNSPVVAEEDTQEKTKNSFRCPTCPKTFSQATSLNTHIKTHSKSKDQRCNVCEKSFRWPKDLKYHKNIHTGETPFGCKICSKAYTHPGLLSKHRRIHTGEKPHRCQQCSKTFRDAGNLQQHVRIHTGERPHSCTQCGKRFNSLGDLKKHSRIHTGERPYDCKQCRKTFNQAGHLKVHMRVHTGAAAYSCDECGKKFSLSNTLKMHLQTHTQEEHSCTYCKKICTTPRRLKRHEKTHTTEKVFFCSQCGKIYTDKQSLKKHLKSHTSQE